MTEAATITVEGGRTAVPFDSRKLSRNWVATKANKSEKRWTLTHKHTGLSSGLESPRLADLRKLVVELNKQEIWNFREAPDPTDFGPCVQAMREALEAFGKKVGMPEWILEVFRTGDRPVSTALAWLCSRNKRDANLFSVFLEQQKPKPMSLAGMATNKFTGERRRVIVPEEVIADVTMDREHATCSGPCECTVESDGHCSKGWPSQMLAVGAL